MSRYIDADTLKIPSEEMVAKMIINSAPHIDIVRCKECKYYNARYYECECDWASTDHEGGASYSLDRNPDDFCSYGERSE